MEIDDFVEPEIAITAVLAAAIASPRTRKVMRKGLVYGVAGALAAGDIVTSLAKSMRQGFLSAGEAQTQATQGPDEQAQAMQGPDEQTQATQGPDEQAPEASQAPEEPFEAKAEPAPRRKKPTRKKVTKTPVGVGGRSS